MVKEGIVLGHMVSEREIEVDKAKMEAIEKMPPLTSVKGVHSFLGHVGFYRCFIKDFSKIAKPLSNLLAKNVPFNFDQHCFDASCRLKEALILAPIMQALGWNLPFEVMYNASDYAVRVVLGPRKDKKVYVIYYASHTLDEAQINYVIIKKSFWW